MEVLSAVETAPDPMAKTMSLRQPDTDVAFKELIDDMAAEIGV
jgi:hypothetical protein